MLLQMRGSCHGKGRGGGAIAARRAAALAKAAEGEERLGQVERTLQGCRDELENFKACSICMEFYDDERMRAGIKVCGHGMCTICGEAAETKGECPFCRVPIQPGDAMRIF